MNDNGKHSNPQNSSQEDQHGDEKAAGADIDIPEMPDDKRYSVHDILAITAEYSLGAMSESEICTTYYIDGDTFAKWKWLYSLDYI
jgi:hypothetical protein